MSHVPSFELPGAESGSPASLEGLPTGSHVLRIDFASERRDLATLLEFTSPERCFAVIAESSGPSDLTVLTVPSSDIERPELLAAVRTWIDADAKPAEASSLMITLHGAQVFWRRRRAAVVAPAERLKAASLAVVEFTFYEGKVNSIEQSIEARWPELEADAPLAFDFHEPMARRRGALAERFRETVALRGRHARLLPIVHRPPVYPPTLASQISERLRERSRVAERLEFCDQQLDVFEGVYEMCGERVSEFFLARKGHTLEWIIIVFLAFQTLLLMLERVAATGT
jgi:hypothetical protein